MMKKLRYFWTLLLLAVVSGVWAETTTVTASKVSNTSVTWTGSGEESWAVVVDGGATNQNVTNSYAQVGTKNSPSTSMTFTTSGISGIITSIVVDCASYQGKGTIGATVGGATFGESQSIPSWSSNSGGDVTFEGSASGEIVITMTNATDGRAMYIKSITVTYTGEEVTEPSITVTPASVNVEAVASEGTLDMSVKNLDVTGASDFDIMFCDAEGNELQSVFTTFSGAKKRVPKTNTDNWLTAEVVAEPTGDANSYVVNYSVTENTVATPRTEYFKVKVGDVESNVVTVTQEGFAEKVSYKLVTANYELTSGRYLIKATEAAVVFDGSLETLDAVNNYQGSGNVIENIITTDKDIYFTLEKVAGGYTIKSASGKYIGKTATGNGLDISETKAYLNTISFDQNGSAVITSSGGSTLRFNSASNQMRFRFFGSGQTSVALYKEVTENETVLVTIKDGFKATTFSCDKALDFTSVEGITAYIITDANGTTQAVTTVLANTGLYIERTEAGAEASFEIPVIENADAVTGNLLVATAALPSGSVLSDDAVTYYAFGKQNGKEAFYKVSTTTAYTPSANKAVLEVNQSANSAPQAIVIGGDVTGIDTVGVRSQESGAIYNLQGQRVNKAQKGVFIQNGRKVVVK